MEEMSLEVAKKLSRYVKKKQYSKMVYSKRCHCSVYDYVENKSRGICVYEAPTIDELNIIGNEVGFISELNEPDKYAISLIEFLKKNKINTEYDIIELNKENKQ